MGPVYLDQADEFIENLRGMPAAVKIENGFVERLELRLAQTDEGPFVIRLVMVAPLFVQWQPQLQTGCRI
jgi:hypothetical protein